MPSCLCWAPRGGYAACEIQSSIHPLCLATDIAREFCERPSAVVRGHQLSLDETQAECFTLSFRHEIDRDHDRLAAGVFVSSDRLLPVVR